MDDDQLSRQLSAGAVRTVSDPAAQLLLVANPRVRRRSADAWLRANRLSLALGAVGKQ